ncbi:MAG: flagellar biosynthetic protein FliR [Chlamydia sp.]
MGVDYIQLFARGTAASSSPMSLLALTFLAAGRLAPVIGLSPFFGARILPNPVKLALVLCFTAIALPKLACIVTEPLVFDLSLILLFFRELFVGLIFGFFLGLPFLMVSSAGVYIDHQRGAASLMTNDPTIQNQSSPIGTLYNMLLIVLFWSVQGPFFVLNSLYYSYDVIPPDKFMLPIFLGEQSLVYDKILHALYIFVATSVQLCTPALLSILMTDTFLGIINRLAPQVQITFLGMGLKSWFALLLVCIGLMPFMNQLTKEIEGWLRGFQELVFYFNQASPNSEMPVLPPLVE